MGRVFKVYKENKSDENYFFHFFDLKKITMLNSSTTPNLQNHHQSKRHRVDKTTNDNKHNNDGKRH